MSDPRPTGWQHRDALRPRISHMAYASEVPVWLLGPDGKVFSATVLAAFLGVDTVTAGTHASLVWWPFTEGK